MYKKMIAAMLFAQTLIACADNKQKTEEAVTVEKKDTMQVTTEISYKDVAFDSKKDLVCGMPVTAGVSDTAHYEGKVYGFCAKECKAEFLKSPKQYLTVK